MAVLISTGSKVELVDGADVEDVTLGRGLRPGPRVLRRFDVGEPRRPAGRPRSISVPSRPEPTACRVRPARHPLLQLFAIGALAALAVICLGLLYQRGAGGAVADVPSRTVLVHVREGDTLSSVADRSAPSGDRAAVMSRIVELNRLTDAQIVPGQPLVVPDGRSDISR
jgi:hypothetical protein